MATFKMIPSDQKYVYTDHSGATAALEASLAADIAKTSIDRAILREFSEAVEECWDLRAFINGHCTEL